MSVQLRREELQGVAEGASDDWKCMRVRRSKTGRGVNPEEGKRGTQKDRWSTAKRIVHPLTCIL